MISKAKSKPVSTQAKALNSQPTPSGFLAILVLCGLEHSPFHMLIHSSMHKKGPGIKTLLILSLKAFKKGLIGHQGSLLIGVPNVKLS
jgi:hypothetical protein